MRIMMHVADRVEVHEARHRVDDDEHHGSQRVDAEGPFDVDAAGLYPAQNRNLDDLVSLMAHGDVEEDDPGEHRDDDHQTGGDVFRSLGADLSTEQAGDQEADQGEKDDSLVDHDPISPSSC